MFAKTLRCIAIGALVAILSRGHLDAGSPTGGSPTGAKTPDIKNLPAPADLKELQAHPKQIHLKGNDQTQQLIVTGVLDSRLQDLTGEVKYEVADPGIVRVTAAGRVLPLANGSTTITAKFGERSA